MLHLKDRFVLLIFAWAFFILIPLSDADLYTQIRLGQISEGTGATQVMLRESLVFLRLNEFVPNPGWLVQQILMIIDSVAGLIGIHLFFSFFAALALVMAIPGSVGVAPSALALVVSFSVLMSNADVRPQLLALFFIVLCGKLAHCFSITKKASYPLLLLFPILLFVWIGIHPSLSLGILFFLVTTTVYAIQKKYVEATSQGIVLSIFILYYYTLVPPIFRELAQTNLYIARTVLGVSEWLPAWHAHVIQAMLPFFASIPITAYFLFKTYKSQELSEVAVMFLFGIATAYAARFGLFYAVLALPVWAKGFAQLVDVRKFARLSILTVTGIMLVNNNLGKLSEPIPKEASTALAHILPQGLIYNYREYGGTLVYFGSPSWKVLIDGRLYLYSEEELRRYYREAAGLVPLENILAAYNPVAFVLHPQFHAGLEKLLAASPAWKKITESQELSVWIPQSQRNS